MNAAARTSTLMDEAARIAKAFAGIETFVFDLDNTLYPASSDLWPKIDDRITLFMIRLFGLDSLSLRALQKHYYQRYGTTLRGLMTEHGVDAETYLRYVHDVDRSSLKPDHTLAAALAALQGRKLILTNGSREHAVETARALGVDHLFEDVFDIVAAEFIAKPDAEVYDRFFLKHVIDPRRAVLFEDLARNLEIPHRHGVTTVLVEPPSEVAAAREHWEIAAGVESHVDFVTSDLAAFLEIVAAARPVAPRAESSPLR